MGRCGRWVPGFVLAALIVAAPARAAFDPVYEVKNFSKIEERATYITDTPAYELLLAQKGAIREAQALEIQAGDPGRTFEGQLCWQKMNGCAGDVRMYDWVTRGAGIALPVAWTARNGSTISGHLWATSDGPSKRPGIVLTSGSVQAPEEVYWFAAEALAKAGYVVLTWDVQGQGYSDTIGEGADETDGVPSQLGRPFYDGTEDALDFLLSTPSSPYVPRKSCSSGTSHAGKQAARVKAGKVSAYDPLSGLVDPTHIGLIGQSLGASAVSYIGQLDPRVDAVVGMDNLSSPAASNLGSGIACASGSSPRPATIVPTKPGLGISNDYGLTPQPNTSEPDVNGKVGGSQSLSKAGVDSMEVVIRGGTHYEGAFIPNVAFGGTLRGNDLEAWYLTAWFDKYLRHDPTADARLLSDRWRGDAQEAAVDPDKDGNVFSRYYRSRVDIHTDSGAHVVCESLREAKDCGALTPDGLAVPYDLVKSVQAKEASADGPGREAAKAWTITTDPAGAIGAPPAANAEPAGTAAPACADTVRPTARFARGSSVGRRGLRVAGRAADLACGGTPGTVSRVLVSAVRLRGKRCQFLGAAGHLTRPLRCRFAHALPAYRTATWSFSTRRALPGGAYRVQIRPVDAVGNVGATRTLRLHAR